MVNKSWITTLHPFQPIFLLAPRLSSVLHQDRKQKRGHQNKELSDSCKEFPARRDRTHHLSVPRQLSRPLCHRHGSRRSEQQIFILIWIKEKKRAKKTSSRNWSEISVTFTAEIKDRSHRFFWWLFFGLVATFSVVVGFLAAFVFRCGPILGSLSGRVCPELLPELSVVLTRCRREEEKWEDTIT